MSRERASCPRWCDETPGHRGNHIGYLWDAFGAPENIGRTLSLTMECGNAESKPLPVLSVNGTGAAQIRLSWGQAERLAYWLADTAERWKP